MSEYYRDIEAQLDALAGDPEVAHAEAERLILAYLKNANHGGATVVRAYERARERVWVRDFEASGP